MQEGSLHRVVSKDLELTLVPLSNKGKLMVNFGLWIEMFHLLEAFSNLTALFLPHFMLLLNLYCRSVSVCQCTLELNYESDQLKC